MSVLLGGWEKIWSCCGVRLGSVVAPTTELQKAVKAKQVRDEPGVGIACFMCRFVEYCWPAVVMLSAFVMLHVSVLCWLLFRGGVAKRFIACESKQ